MGTFRWARLKKKKGMTREQQPTEELAVMECKRNGDNKAVPNKQKTRRSLAASSEGTPRHKINGKQKTTNKKIRRS